jgi:hypothetical protein
VSAIALLCLVLLCTPVQLDCSLVALQADLLFTPVDACSVRLLLIVLRLGRPTLRIHSWSLQHTPARTYCSPLSCMRSKSQLRLPCQLISIILLTISSSFLTLLINEQLRLPCRLLVLYCSPLAVLSLYCSSMSSCDFHVDLYSGILATPIILWDLAADVVLYLYSGIRCHFHTPVGLCCYESSMRQVFLAASLPTLIAA